MNFNKKKLIMILLFSVVLFATISTTWAADIDDNNINNVALNETKSFDEIQGLIDSAEENSTITLNGTYVSSGKSIVINKTLTIEGNNAILDGNGSFDKEYSSRIFEVNQNDCIFKDITFINGFEMNEGSVENGGAIISEYMPGVIAKPEFFVHRNRIISGLSNSVIVVEAKERSGSLITAEYAVEQGKCVWAVPGGIFCEYSKGTNELIKDGANCLTDIRDILRG